MSKHRLAVTLAPINGRFCSFNTGTTVKAHYIGNGLYALERLR